MELSMELLPGDGRHLYEQIYEHIREEIRTGKLLAGERLPSTRQLAASLKIARTTVELAYEQLEEEGYLVIRRGSGAYVCETQNIPDVLGNSSAVPAGCGSVSRGIGRETEEGRIRRGEDGEKSVLYIDQYGHKAEQADFASARYQYEENHVTDEAKRTIDFSPRTIDMSVFPYATWRRLLRGILTGDRADLFRRGNPQGDLELRTTIARYLHLSRGCHCDPEQIVIGAGNDYLMMLLGVLLGGRSEKNGGNGDSIGTVEHVQTDGGNDSASAQNQLRIGMESPTYLRAAQVLQAMGFSVEPIQSDAGGMCTDALERSGCQLAYLMPARQFPTGVMMPYPRRAELLSWAEEKENRYLIEDDYDSEFKYRGRPVPSLQSMDERGKVIYLGTFSKSIAPAIRVSYLILPYHLLETFYERAGFLSCTVPRLDQAILNEFIQDGYFERYLNRMRTRYRAKHDLMLELLKPLEKQFDIRGQGSGLHLVLRLRKSSDIADRGLLSEQEFAMSARRAGVLVYPMSEQNLPQGLPDGQEAAPAILLGYAALTEEEIREGVGRLIRIWGPDLT